MIKIFRYLKPYILSILAVAALLFLQANMELALPDYMSRIVNVGIQQGGIDSAVPEAIRAVEMDKLTLFMNSSTKQLIRGSYSRIDPISTEYDDYIDEYPILESEAIYVLTDSTEELTGKLTSEIGKAFFAKKGIESPEQRPFGIEVDQMIIEQNGIIAVKAEYEAMGMDTAKTQSSYILHIGAIMLLFTLISAAATIVVGLLAAQTSAGLARNVRRDVFTKVENFSGEEFDKFSTASLITRSTNDITQIQMVIFLMLRMIIYAPILGVGGVIRALGKAPSMAWIIGLAVLVLLALIITVFIIALPKFKKIQKLVDRLNLVARENLSGLMVVRAFNRQKFEEDRFDTANKNLTKTNLFVIRVMVVMMPLMILVMNLISVTIIWVGAKQVAASAMQVGDMMAFMQYSMQIVMSFLMLTMIFIFLPRASVSANRINEVLETELSIKDPENPKILTEKVKGLLEFNNVCFRYPGADADVLSNLNFTAEPGQTTAIIGATGAGKSTTVNLIPRFYDVSEGEILLDGDNIKDLAQQDLRNQIGYVPQKITLFSGTIESNLRYADENASDEIIREAAETAQAMEFINDKEEKFDAPISQAGTNISGGQKQCLSIARALVKKFPVFIFDDSFSALDFRTDAALRWAMKEKTGDSTLIIIAQRISTIMNAEQIIVLDEGKIVGKGTHRELLASCEEYKEIALSQLEMKELA